MKKIVRVGNVECGAEQLFLIAGPCVVEDEKTMMDTAEFLVGLSQKLHLPLIYKSSFQKDNRSSSDFYSGPGMENGLAILKKIKEQFNVPVITDIHYPEQILPAAEVVDIIQIPAYLVMQTTLVVEAAKTGKVNGRGAEFTRMNEMLALYREARAIEEAALGRVLPRGWRRVTVSAPSAIVERFEAEAEAAYQARMHQVAEAEAALRASNPERAKKGPANTMVDRAE